MESWQQAAPEQHEVNTSRATTMETPWRSASMLSTMPVTNCTNGKHHLMLIPSCSPKSSHMLHKWKTSPHSDSRASCRADKHGPLVCFAGLQTLPPRHWIFLHMVNMFTVALWHSATHHFVCPEWDYFCLPAFSAVFWPTFVSAHGETTFCLLSLAVKATCSANTALWGTFTVSAAFPWVYEGTGAGSCLQGGSSTLSSAGHLLGC